MGGQTCTVYVILILHTVGGEWYSNVDFAPSHSDNTLYAENFKAAADVIFNETKSTISSSSDLYPIKQIATDFATDYAFQFFVSPSADNSFMGMMATHEKSSYLSALNAMPN